MTKPLNDSCTRMNSRCSTSRKRILLYDVSWKMEQLSTICRKKIKTEKFLTRKRSSSVYNYWKLSHVSFHLRSSFSGNWNICFCLAQKSDTQQMTVTRHPITPFSFYTLWSVVVVAAKYSLQFWGGIKREGGVGGCEDHNSSSRRNLKYIVINSLCSDIVSILDLRDFKEVESPKCVDRILTTAIDIHIFHLI